MNETPIKYLQCSCCGNYDYGRQWWNRDLGYGLCKDCSDYIEQREDIASMKSCYGVKGVHYYLIDEEIDKHEALNKDYE